MVTTYGSKVCKSVRRLPVCSDDCLVVKSTVEEIEFRCVKSGSALHKMDNSSPVRLAFPHAVECSKQQ